MFALCFSLLSLTIAAAETDFVAAVASTRPIAFYRLNAASGRSEIGTTAYSPKGGVTATEPGLFGAGSQSVKLDGHDGYIVTTQAGGVNGAASIMAWVNLDSLPSEQGRYFYVAGESENGNDLDLQFENDNILKFYTAGGGHISYQPPQATLVHRWHMILVTLNTATQSRVMYWDGKAVANDKGDGRPNKTGVFSIGESTVFRGRYLQGQVEEVALWNRPLRAEEVSAIYNSTHSAAGITSAPSSGGQFPSAAKVAVQDDNGPVRLKPEERVAYLFLSSIQLIEADCQYRAKHACTMDQLVSGVNAADGSRLSHLKFDPRTDPNYTYTLAASGMAWEARATAKEPGLMGFYFWSRMFPTVGVYYNPSGSATIIDKELSTRSVEGDSYIVP
jgi:hypothetical protein